MHKVKQMIKNETKMILLDTILDKGLSVNDVIIFGGYPDPPSPPQCHSGVNAYGQPDHKISDFFTTPLRML